MPSTSGASVGNLALVVNCQASLPPVPSLPPPDPVSGRATKGLKSVVINEIAASLDSQPPLNRATRGLKSGALHEIADSFDSHSSLNRVATRGLKSNVLNEIADSLDSQPSLKGHHFSCFTGRVPEDGALLRPCLAGCGCQVTSLHPTHCCGCCEVFGFHGPFCDRKPMPTSKKTRASIVGQTSQGIEVTDRTHDKKNAGANVNLDDIESSAAIDDGLSHVDSVEMQKADLVKDHAKVQEIDLVRKIAGRGFTLGAALEFLCVLLDSHRAFSEIDGLRDAYRAYGDIPSDFVQDFAWFNPEVTTTSEVTYRACVPLSFYRQSAFSDILNGQGQCLPKIMVSHCWENIFVHTLAACVAHVQGKEFFFHLLPQMQTFGGVRAMMKLFDERALLTTFWMCSFSVNQHSIGCSSSPWPCTCGMTKVLAGPNSEIGSFDTMMHLLKKKHTDFAQVIALDRETCFECHVDRDISLSFQGNAKAGILNHTPEMDGSRTRHASRLLLVGDAIEYIDDSDSSATRLKIKVRRVLSVLTRVWVVAEIVEAFHSGISQYTIGHFPLSMSGPKFLHRLRAVDVLKSEASDPADLQMVLGHVRKRGSVEECNETLLQALSKKPLGLPVFVYVGLALVSICTLGPFLLLKEYSEYRIYFAICWTVGFVILLHQSTFGRWRAFLILGLMNDSRLSKEVRKARHAEVRHYIKSFRWYGERLYTWGYSSRLGKRVVYMILRVLPMLSLGICIQVVVAFKCFDRLYRAELDTVCKHATTVIIAKSVQHLYVIVVVLLMPEFRNSLAHKLGNVPVIVKAFVALGPLVFFLDAYVDAALLFYGLTMFSTLFFSTTIARARVFVNAPPI